MTNAIAKSARRPTDGLPRRLLACGVLAGPFYVVVVLAQGLTRHGFDLTRHDASLLSNGSLGWIQISNFLVTGALVIAFAVGLGRALEAGRGAVWAPRFIAGYGLGLIGGGIFIADPMNGFPPGAPAGHPATITVHGLLHLVAAGLGFLCLVVACFIMARRFAADRSTGWMVYSIVAGAAFALAFAGLASGSASAVVVLAFWAALILVWSWMAAVAIHFYRRVS
jgi:uncharacterized protein DUF998